MGQRQAGQTDVCRRTDLCERIKAVIPLLFVPRRRRSLRVELQNIPDGCGAEVSGCLEGIFCPVFTLRAKSCHMLRLKDVFVVVIVILHILAECSDSCTNSALAGFE